jgi:peptidoglycan/LPS O-acetylase OafA/YrhL
MTTLTQPGRIKELDGLRGISVILVILYHLLGFSQATPLSPLFKSMLRCMGPLGVHIFFVISGFIITKLLMEEFRSTGSVSLARFCAKRFFRIIPAYWFYLMAICLLGLGGWIPFNGTGLVLSLLFLSDTGFFPSEQPSAWFTYHTWSLSVEEQYYLFFPLIIWVILRGNLKAATFVLAGFYLVSILSLKITHDVQTRFPSSGFNISFLAHFRFIIVGVMIAFYHLPLGRAVRPLTSLFPLGLGAFLVLGGTAANFLGKAGFFYDAIDAIAVAFLVLWIMENPRQGGWLRWTPVQWVGECSYSLYLWQQLFTAGSFQYGAWKLNQLPYSLFLLLGCAAFSLYFIERRFIRVGRRILAGRMPS